MPVEGVRLPHAADPIAFRRIARVVRRHRPVLLHTHLVHADFHGLLAGRLARVPVLASTKHGFNPFRSRRAFAAADRTVGRLVDLHIAISAGLARYLAETEGFAESSFEVVHYGIEPGPEPEPYAAPRHGSPSSAGSCRSRATTRFCARSPRRRVSSRRSSWRSPARGRSRQSCARRRARSGWTAGCASSARFPERRGVMERASVVLVPSLGEGFGMVALEAMERGRAVVASAVGGLPEIVAAGETGLLVPPADADALAAAVVELAGDPDRARAFGAAGRARALESFSQERCTARTDELYRAALARARP